MFSHLKQPCGVSSYVRPQLAFWPCPRLSRAAFRMCAILTVLALWLFYVYSTNGYSSSSGRSNPSSSQPSSRLTSPIRSSAQSATASAIIREKLSDMDSNGMDLDGIGPSDCGDPAVDRVNVTRRGQYIVLNNLIRRRHCYGYNESITLTTHGTYDLLDNLPFLSHRWQGPLSVAVYAPGTDLQVSIEYVLWLRQCNQDVSNFVTFHFIFPEYPDTLSATQAIVAASNVTNRLDVTTQSADNANVTSAAGIKYDFVRALRDLPLASCSRQCNLTVYQFPISYRTRNALPYPINVCRNVARLNGNTHFILASDIELYPNANVISRFLVFAHNSGLIKNGIKWTVPASSSATSSTTSSSVVANSARRIYVLPIFEVDKSVSEAPTSKAILLDLYRHKKAVYFHKHVCSYCNIIPKLNQWLLLKSPPQLGTFLIVKRHKPYHRWEPIYIGTNAEPLYDERLTWEGQQDKMTQMYELCLMDYDVALLDDAFLVHRPGIKKKVAAEYKRKATFIKNNNRIYVTAIRELEAIHGTEPRCK